MNMNNGSAALAEFEEAELDHPVSGIGALVRSETEAQIAAAHRYPRSISSFLAEAISMATTNQEIAEACMYSVPRGGKVITGPSVRLAEICASAYGNLQYGARVIAVEDKEIVAQGAAWDMQKNNRGTMEVRRRITDKNGHRFKDDMVIVTGNAACSIALRNALFRVIPFAHVMSVYDNAKRVAVGDAKTLDTRRTELLSRFQKLGVMKDRVLARLDKKGIEDITLEDFELLIGLGTAIKNGEMEIDAAFPVEAPAPVEPAQDGRRINMRGNGKAKGDTQPAAATPAATASPATTAPAEPHDKVTGEMPPKEAQLTDAERLRREVAETDAADRKAADPDNDGR